MKALLLDTRGDLRCDQDRELTLRRPCECGCDQRGPNGVGLVGYLNGIRDGLGITVLIYDETEYQRLERVMGA